MSHCANCDDLEERINNMQEAFRDEDDSLRAQVATLTAELEREKGLRESDKAYSWEMYQEHKKMADERDALKAERDDWSRVARERAQKLAEAGVEGSPPPGMDTTIGLLQSQLRYARAERGALKARVEGLEALLCSECRSVAALSPTTGAPTPREERRKECCGSPDAGHERGCPGAAAPPKPEDGADE